MDQAEKDLEEMFVDTLEELGDAMIYLEKGLQILRKKKHYGLSRIKRTY